VLGPVDSSVEVKIIKHVHECGTGQHEELSAAKPDLDDVIGPCLEQSDHKCFDHELPAERKLASLTFRLESQKFPFYGLALLLAQYLVQKARSIAHGHQV
jgi:hypothetical protein